MAARDDGDSIDPILEVPGHDSGRICRLVGRVLPQGDGRMRFYPTVDTGLWLEIDTCDVIACLEPHDPSKPSTLVVAERSRMSLRMNVTALAVEDLLATVGTQSTTRNGSGWRAAPRNRSQAAALRRPVAVRKIPSP